MRMERSVGVAALQRLPFCKATESVRIYTESLAWIHDGRHSTLEPFALENLRGLRLAARELCQN